MQRFHRCHNNKQKNAIQHQLFHAPPAGGQADGPHKPRRNKQGR